MSVDRRPPPRRWPGSPRARVASSRARPRGRGLPAGPTARAEVGPVAAGRRRRPSRRASSPPAARSTRPLLEAALGAAVARAAGEPTPVAAMRRLFKPTDVVGIKVNCLGGRGVSTRPEVALQLAAFLQAAGVPADRIYVWDRTDRELRAAGYAIDRGRGVRVFGTNEDFDGRLVEWGPSASRFDRVLATELTALISCSVLKDHGLAGASLTMKNWYGVDPQPEQAARRRLRPVRPPPRGLPRHPRQAAPQRRGRRARAVPRRARAARPRWAWPYGGFLASTDPVAVDAVGRQVLEARRKEVGLPPLAAEGREPRPHRRRRRGWASGVADLAPHRESGGVR